MKELVKKSLAISKAINWNTNIWYNETVTLDFSDLNKASVVVFCFDTPLNTKHDRKAVVCRLNDVQEWVKDNRDKVGVNGSKVSFKEEDIYSWEFSKQRGFSIRESQTEESVGMPPIEKNGMTQRNVQCKDGKFRDRFFDEDSKAYSMAFGRGWTSPDGIMHYKAKEPVEFIEVDDVK